MSKLHSIRKRFLSAFPPRPTHGCRECKSARSLSSDPQGREYCIECQRYVARHETVYESLA
jgi:hypothetical protein